MKNKNKMKTAAMAAIVCGAVHGATINVVPAPNKVVEKEGFFNGDLAAISYQVDSQIPEEGYRLCVCPESLSVAYSTEAGLFYALQTLEQLKSPDGVPCVEIEDAPRFKWRGLHWDDCRHFMGKEALLKALDAMAMNKLNVLHWHLTEDQGWRIEIKKYPRLTEVGSIRPGSPKPVVLKDPDDSSYWQNNNMKYGPYFYTQQDIKEVVEYAAKRHITVIPEIELPGHALAAISAYPELGCTGEKFDAWWRWGVSEHIFCGGNDDTIKFLEDVLDEVCELFPGPIVHIGGDEAPKKAWVKCEKCQKRIKDLGLEGEEGLQGWMTDHFTRYLASKGKRAVGWDEILDGNPGKDTIVMSWRGPGGGIAAAKRGNDAVMTPVDPCYIDNPQGLEDDPYEYINYGFQATLERCYGFNPTAGIPEDEQFHILGGQGNNWTEYTWYPSEYEWKIWPRMCALAECLWTNLENKDWPDFKRRVAVMRRRLIRQRHINCAPIE